MWLKSNVLNSKGVDDYFTKLIDENEIIKIWKEYFNDLLNEENNLTEIEIEQSLTDENDSGQISCEEFTAALSKTV